MPFFFLPISFFTKEYIAGVLTLPLIFIGSTLLFNFIRGKRNFYLHPLVLSFLAGLILIQAVINIHTGSKFASYDPWSHFFQFIKILLLVLANYFFIRQTITEKKHVVQFLKGAFLFLSMAIFVGFLQKIYIKTGYFSDVISLIGKYLEAHWNFSRFYEKGSYVQTIPRMNGLSQEASIFASQVGILGFPLLLSLMKNRFPLFAKLKRWNFLLYSSFFVLITLLSVFIKSTSGLLLVALAWGFLFLIFFNQKNKKIQLILFSGLMLLLVGLVLVYFCQPRFQHFLNEYLLQKLEGESGNNRTAITVALFQIFFHHPFFGVGYSGPYLFSATIGHLQGNSEIVSTFLADPYLPQLSELGMYLANYGLIFVAPIGYYFGKIQWTFIRLKRNDGGEEPLIAVVNDMMLYFLPLFFISQISVIRTVNSCYLFTLFFFPAALSVLRGKVRYGEGKESVV